MQLSDDEWRKKLTPEQYAVLRKGVTEAPFSGALLHNQGMGVYTCVACGTVLFTSEQKFDSGSGWPSFYDIAAQGTVTLSNDHSYGMERTEAHCATCGSHLGHVFRDAPDQPTGMECCINSAALCFVKK